MDSRIVYTTNWADQTVTIDYNQTLRQFLTDKEQRPFSAERIMKMLNHWARINKIDITLVGRLHIAAGGAHCVLTQQALNTLSLLYQQHPDWQIEYPFVSDVLAYGSAAS
ncbi:MAG: hypothetical protein H0U76_18575 [Ktedonobacteraceae bacterium]|nr:hypothetical protein [Ktedonobacteraceae bacterium]